MTSYRLLHCRPQQNLLSRSWPEQLPQQFFCYTAFQLRRIMFPQSHSGWLADNYHVIAPDLPGFWVLGCAQPRAISLHI